MPILFDPGYVCTLVVLVYLYWCCSGLVYILYSIIINFPWFCIPRLRLEQNTDNILIIRLDCLTKYRKKDRGLLLRGQAPHHHPKMSGDIVMSTLNVPRSHYLTLDECPD